MICAPMQPFLERGFSDWPSLRHKRHLRPTLIVELQVFRLGDRHALQSYLNFLLDSIRWRNLVKQNS